MNQEFVRVAQLGTFGSHLVATCNQIISVKYFDIIIGIENLSFLLTDDCINGFLLIFYSLYNKFKYVFLVCLI